LIAEKSKIRENFMLYGAYLAEVSGSLLTATLREWQAEFPKAGVFALLPEAEKDQIELLQNVCRTLAMPLLGAVFPALVTANGFATSGLVLLRLDVCPQWVLIDELSGQNGIEFASKLVECFGDQSEGPRTGEASTLFFVFDGLLPNINTLLHRVHGRFGHRVRYSGINAGSESFHPMDCLFDQEREIQSGCLVLLLPESFSFIVEHQYPVSKPLFQATSTTGNRIDKIDGKPAIAVYQALLKSEFGVELTPENFYQYAVHYPFGLVTALDVLVRIPVALTADGSIYCVGEIPPNAVLRLLSAPKLEESQCVRRIASRVTTDGQTMFAFYCAGRRMHFGDAAESELQQLVSSSHSTELLGALTLGEIGTDAEIGFPEFHNAALVCLTSSR
jgi:hypothetical protein